jgi:hypothetical protein
MEPISSRYRDKIIEMMKNVRHTSVVTEKDVFQKANPLNRPYIDSMVEELLLPGSGILNLENLHRLCELSRQGASCLILMEHYSNFDIPCLYYLLEREGENGKQIADSIISIAGMKLNEENPIVLAFTEAYTRIVIYPSRSLKHVSDPAVLKEEKHKNNAINRAAMHEMIRAKKSGHIMLVFPAGTRYRPWDPSSRKGLKEIDSYIKSFDYMVLVGISGNVLRINPSEAMHEDFVTQDVVLYNAGPVIECGPFRKRMKAEAPFGDDSKQYVVDRVMDELQVLHEAAERSRAPFLNGKESIQQEG